MVKIKGHEFTGPWIDESASVPAVLSYPWGSFPTKSPMEELAEFTRRAFHGPSVFVQLYQESPLLSLLAGPKPEVPKAWAAAPPVSIRDLPVTVSRSAIKSVLSNG